MDSGDVTNQELEDKGLFLCPECPKFFKTKIARAGHRRSHVKEAKVREQAKKEKEKNELGLEKVNLVTTFSINGKKYKPGINRVDKNVAGTLRDLQQNYLKSQNKINQSMHHPLRNAGAISGRH